MRVWLNGALVERENARVSIFDAGIQHGVGLFETMQARHRRVFRVGAHMARLIASAGELRLTERLRPGPLADAVQQTIDANEWPAARVRLTITGGNLDRLQSTGRSSADPTIFIVAQPPTEYPPAFFEQGTAVTVADGRLNPLDPSSGHKTLNYWSRIRALQAAGAARAGEALWFTVSNHLACGSVSNVFLVRGGELLTPIARCEEEHGALPACVLPGITRAAVLELAAAAGIAVHRRMLDIEDLLEADEVFLTNSSWGLLPVVRVEKEAIGTGTVGETTQRLRRGWLDLVERETAAPAV